MTSRKIAFSKKTKRRFNPLPSPTWHHEELNKREQKIAQSEAKFFPFSEVKKDCEIYCITVKGVPFVNFSESFFNY
jgi:hypothetical protein